jgi:hypothetical protein
MVLSNAERQARYREKMRQLAARGAMSPAQAEVLFRVRLHLREWKRSIAFFEDREMRLYTNNVDTSDQHVAMLRRLVADNELLLKRYDPDELTADDAIEPGEMPRGQCMNLLPGRYVTYRLDDAGRASELALFETELQARAHAAGNTLGVGVVGDDMWSIAPVDS